MAISPVAGVVAGRSFTLCEIHVQQHQRQRP
jgi:hypothetical protein